MTSDEEAMRLLDDAAVSYQPVLTKTDALNPPEIRSVMENVAAIAAVRPAALAGIIATSARASLGVPELRQALAELAAG
jgi:GTP-binding protein